MSNCQGSQCTKQPAGQPGQPCQPDQSCQSGQLDPAHDAICHTLMQGEKMTIILEDVIISCVVTDIRPRLGNGEQLTLSNTESSSIPVPIKVSAETLNRLER